MRWWIVNHSSNFAEVGENRATVRGGDCLSMTTWSYETPLFVWLISTTISFICFVIALFIFLRERHKRQKPDCIIPSKYLAVFSYLCVALGPIATFLSVVEYIPELCVINDVFGPLGYLQYAAMECYQLSRLHYCFSRQKV